MISVKNVYKNFGEVSVLRGVSCEIEKGERVRMVGFGTFETRQKAERTYVSPQSKKRVTVPTSRQPVFHAGKDLKERVAK